MNGVCITNIGGNLMNSGFSSVTLLYSLGGDYCQHVMATHCPLKRALQLRGAGGRLNIKMSSYQYRDPHVKDKTVSPTVLSLTWEPPYLGKTVFILRQGPVSYVGLLAHGGHSQYDVMAFGIHHSSQSIYVYLIWFPWLVWFPWPISVYAYCHRTWNWQWTTKTTLMFMCYHTCISMNSRVYVQHMLNTQWEKRVKAQETQIVVAVQLCLCQCITSHWCNHSDYLVQSQWLLYNNLAPMLTACFHIFVLNPNATNWRINHELWNIKAYIFHHKWIYFVHF